MRRILTMGAILALCILLTGCWDLKEIEDMVIVRSIGIDKGPGENELALIIEQIPTARTTAGGAEQSTQPMSLVHQASGVTLYQAMDRLQSFLPGRIFLGYTSIIVVGEDAAKQDFKRVLEFLDRGSELRRSAFVFVSPGKAVDVISTADPHAMVAGNVLRGILTESDNTGTAFPTKLADILKSLPESGIEPIVTKVEAIRFPPSSEGGAGQNSGTQGTAGMPATIGAHGTLAQVPGDYKVAGMAVFRGVELVGWLDEVETRGWGWICGRIKAGHSVILNPQSVGGRFEPLTFLYDGGRSSLKFVLDDGGIEAHLLVEARGRVVEWTARKELITPDILESLSADMATIIKDEIETALRKVQLEYYSDVFGFGLAFSKSHYREWQSTFKEKWRDIFPELPVSVEVKATITSSQTLIKPLEIR